MPAEIHCPRCNAVFAASPSTNIGARVPCPRCDASFTVLHLHEVQAAPNQNGAALESPLPRPVRLSAQRAPSVSWRPVPSLALDLFDCALLLTLLGVLCSLDNRLAVVGTLLRLNLAIAVLLELLYAVARWALGRSWRPFLLSHNTRGIYRAPWIYSLFLLVQLLFVVLTLGEGNELLKGMLLLGGVTLTTACRFAFSLADLDNLPRFLGVAVGVLLVGLVIDWLIGRHIAAYTDHRYFRADLTLCFLAVVVVAQVFYATFRIQDPRKFRVAITVVAVMGVMSTASFGLARSTVGFRRENDAGLRDKKTKRPGLGEIPNREPVATVPALELDGLRRLPRDTVAIAAVRPAELLTQEDGRSQLTQPIQIGPLSIPVHQLEQWTGLKAEEIDHIVFGVRGNTGDLIPRFATIVRTRVAYDAEAVRDKFKKIELHPGARKQGVYRFQLESRPPFNEGMLRCVDDHTLLIDWQQRDVGWITSDPHNDVSHLAKELRAIVKERMSPHGSIWVAGHSEDWAKTFAVVNWIKLDKPEAQLLESVQTFLVWTPNEPRNTWMASVHCRDAEKAEETRKYLEKRLKSDDRKVTTLAEGDWVMIQVQLAK